MSDHTIQYVKYSQPVHYKENGKWIDYDMQLNYEKAKTSEEFDGYKCNSPNFDVKFSEETNNSALVSLTKEKYYIDWSFDNVSKFRSFFSEPKIASKETKVSNKAFDNFEASNVKDRILYKNIKKDCDLEYEINPNGIKENIIINDELDEYVFNFSINAKNLVLELDEQGNIIGNDIDTSEQIIMIPRGYMFDSMNNSSTSIEYNLINKNHNQYQLTVTADKEWINSAERVFPVTIDPQIVISSNDDITVCNISTTKTASNIAENGNVLIGQFDILEYGRCSLLLKFKLPNIGNGNTVTSAKVMLQESNVLGISNSSSNSEQVNAYKVSTLWTDASSALSRPLIDYTVLDYDRINTSDLDTIKKGYTVQKSWDITKVVNEWYLGEDNHGILLEGNSGLLGTDALCGSFNLGSKNATNAIPIFTINYRGSRGVESYWTHTDLTNGKRGVACVNDHTGNLTYFHTDISTSGNKMPIEIKHVYNSCDAYNTGRLLPNAGKGWKLNIQQTVRVSQIYGLSDEEAKNYPYVYEDGDATTHFFFKDTSSATIKYVDEDGLGLELTIRKNNDGKSDGFIITDKNGNIMTFNVNGNLIEYKDSKKNANTMSIVYESVKLGELDAELIKEVIDGSGHKISIFADSSDGYMLKKIIDENGNALYYSYRLHNSSGSSSDLEKIILPNGIENKFKYTTIGNSLEYAIDGETNKYVLFKYDAVLYGETLKGMIEFDSTDINIGQSVYFDRKTKNQTIVTYKGLDGKILTDDDIHKLYQFDNYGRTISIHTYTGKKDYGASIYEYTNSSTATLKQNNKIVRSAAVSGNTNNIIKNIGAEYNGSWDISTAVGNCSYTNSYTTTNKYEGNYSLGIHCISSSNDGRVRYYQDIDTSIITPGKTYTLSAYVKAAQIKQVSSNYNHGVGLIVNAVGAQLNAKSEFITTSSYSPDKGWERLYTTFTVPEGAASIRVNLVLKNATGYAYFDNIQLEESDTMSPVNILENSTLSIADSSNSKMPNKWNSGNLNFNENDGITVDENCNTSHFYIYGDSNTNKTIFQTVPINATEDDTYIVSAWAHGQSISPTSNNSSADFNISVRIDYTDGTYKYNHNIPFNKSVDAWQYTGAAISLSDGTASKKTPKSLSVFLRFKGQENRVEFKDIQLIKANSNSFSYDSNGNTVDISKSANQKISNTYNNANLTKSVDVNGYINEYEYDEYNNLTSSTSQTGIVTTYEYNDFGSVLSTAVSDSNSQYILKTETEYNLADEETGISNGAYVTKTSDADGNDTLYDYDLLSGNLNRITNANGVSTDFTYFNETEQLKSVSSAGVTEKYSYSNGNLSSISRTSSDGNDIAYKMTYDGHGNPISTKIGNQVLSTNIYRDYNGVLDHVNYGNGDTVGYNYNDAVNISSLLQNGFETNSYIYNSKGLLNFNKDIKNNLNFEYSYDTINRVSKKSVFDLTTGERLSTLCYEYDLDNNVSILRNRTNYRLSTQSYTYEEDDLLTSHEFATNKKASYNYDAIGRLSSVAYSDNGTNRLTSNYDYYKSERNTLLLDSNYETTKLKTETIGNHSFRYEYDNLGNVTKIKKGSINNNNDYTYTDKLSYEYDALGQLVRENNADLNQTIVYTYNSGGNILKKEIYNYTTEAIAESPLNTIVYSYENSNWKDQLTSYNGEQIVYDEIGNPTNYLGYTMNWFARQLNSLSGNGLNISFSYDDSGIRVSKTTNGATTYYQYDNGVLLYENRGSDEFYYTYDGFGNLSSITHYDSSNTKEEYFVLCNNRGDVIGIYTENGCLTAQYEYGSWGEIISVADANGNEITDSNHIGLLNPIRYRGYYYDSETGYYYLQSRYYNPEIGRFVNADSCVFMQNNLNQTNIYIYCSNNPINSFDPFGLYTEKEQFLLDKANSSFKSKMGYKLSGYTLVEIDPDFDRKYEIVTISYIYQKNDDKFSYKCAVYFYGKVGDIRKMADEMFNMYEFNIERQTAFISLLGEFCANLIFAQIWLLVICLVVALNFTFINQSAEYKSWVSGLQDSDYYGKIQSLKEIRPF